MGGVELADELLGRVLGTVRAQNWTVPVAFTPNVFGDCELVEPDEPPHAAASSAMAPTAAQTSVFCL